MLTDYISPDQRFIACANQDVVYGAGFLPLDKEPIVFQVPDFGDRFWVYALYDARTDEFSEIGKQYGTKPGFYMMVGPDWKGETPAGITAVVRSSTALAFAVPRIFMDDTRGGSRGHPAGAQPDRLLPAVAVRREDEDQGLEQAPAFPGAEVHRQRRDQVGEPGNLLRRVAGGDEAVPPLPGEEALYNWIGSVLEAAAKDPTIMQTLKETAVAAEREMIAPFLQWRYNGRAAGNGWNSPVNNAQWGTDYLNRTGTAKSNMYDNRPEETKYIYTDDDSQGQQLNGQNIYTITFAKGQTPPVKGFWSLTLYNEEHFFHHNPLKRYSLGTKNKNLKLQRGRFADAVCRRQIARQGQGKQLAARA